MSVWAVVLAAGRGKRMEAAGIGIEKQFLEWRGRPLFWHSGLVLARVPVMGGIVFVFPAREQENLGELESMIVDLDNRDGLNLPWLVTLGGERRQDSVYNGLAMLPPDCGRVLVHDAARPFLSAGLAAALAQALDGADAAIPGVPVSDTIKVVRDGMVAETLERDGLRAVQTPQAFRLGLLRKAHELAREQDWEVTDDASMMERMGVPVAVVPGEEENVKITTPADLERLRASEPVAAPEPVVGYGYDVHAYAYAMDKSGQPSRPLKLGGIPIPGAPEVRAHSDGDVLLHALTDALLGCLGQGDIGKRFPDSDPGLDNAASAIFVTEVMQDVWQAGLALTHVDLTVIAQTPRLAPHVDLIRKNVAELLRMDGSRVNIKATTEEGLGFTGEKRGLKAVAVVSALRPATANR